MNIKSVDLNLLLAFDALMREHSVTRAAAEVGITQPAMSSALGRLRALFDDALFVRSSRGMVPTARAIQIAPDIAASLEHVRVALRRPAFEPKEAKLRFRIITTDYVEIVLLAELHNKLAAAAPGIDLAIKRAPTIFELPQADLESGACDLAIGPFPAPIPQSGLFARHLFDDEFVCIARKGHPAVRQKLSLKQFLAAKHAAVLSILEHSGLIDRVLAEKSLKRRVAIGVPNFISVPYLVAETDLIATIPRKLAERFAGVLKLRLFKPPFAIPALRMSLLWHSRVSEESSHKWLRDFIASSATPLR